jgi:hypothetical protein
VPLFQVDLVAFGDGDAQIIKGQGPRRARGPDCPGARDGRGLTAQPWSWPAARDAVSHRRRSPGRPCVGRATS